MQVTFEDTIITHTTHSHSRHQPRRPGSFSPARRKPVLSRQELQRLICDMVD